MKTYEELERENKILRAYVNSNQHLATSVGNAKRVIKIIEDHEHVSTTNQIMDMAYLSQSVINRVLKAMPEYREILNDRKAGRSRIKKATPEMVKTYGMLLVGAAKR